MNTLTFTYKGKEFAVAHKNVEQAQELLNALMEISAETGVHRALSRETTSDIRRWAKTRGHVIGSRGCIPSDIVDEYIATFGSDNLTYKSPDTNKNDIREWAESQGYTLGARGRIPTKIKEEYAKFMEKGVPSSNNN
mgnify:CR=1 FL=1